MCKQLFKIGDKVGSMWGDGEVVDVYKNNEYISVQLSDGGNIKVNADGRMFQDHKYPSIWHKETGTPPSAGERPFEYPIYKKVKKCGCIVKFTGLKFGEVVDSGEFCGGAEKSFEDGVPHTNTDYWADCEPPKWKPTEPTWCWIGFFEDEVLENSMKRLVFLYRGGRYWYVTDGGDRNFCHAAKPCEESEIPGLWREMQCKK